MKKIKTSVILATYNEKENINKLISAILNIFKKNNLECNIVVVDDNSPDKTADIVRKKYRRNKKIKIIVRKNEKGLATAIKRGIEESDGEILVFMDTDFSHDPGLIPKMIRLTKNYEVVSGSRYIKGGGIETKSYRKIATTIMEIYIRIILGTNIKDFTNGFVAVRRDLLDNLNLEEIFYGYGDYCIRLFYYALKRKAKILEIPAFYKFRKEGGSKTNILSHGLQYALEVLKLRFKC